MSNITVTRIEESATECTQFNWHGVDVFFNNPVDENSIELWRSLGDTVYIKELNKPFFKICAKDYVIRGFQGDTMIRIGCQRGVINLSDISEISSFLNLDNQGL